MVREQTQPRTDALRDNAAAGSPTPASADVDLTISWNSLLMIRQRPSSSSAGSSRRSRGSGTHTLGTLGQCPIDFLSRSRAAGACRRLKLYSPKVPGSLGHPVGSSVSGERSESGHQLLETPSAFGLFGVAAGMSDSSLGGSEAFA